MLKFYGFVMVSYESYWQGVGWISHKACRGQQFVFEDNVRAKITNCCTLKTSNSDHEVVFFSKLGRKVFRILWLQRHGWCGRDVCCLWWWFVVMDLNKVLWRVCKTDISWRDRQHFSITRFVHAKNTTKITDLSEFELWILKVTN